MATRLLQVIQFVNVGVGAQATLSHEININGVALLPDYVFLDNGNFSIVATTTTQITVQNDGTAIATVNVNLWRVNSPDRALGGQIQNLTPQPFVVAGGGGSAASGWQDDGTVVRLVTPSNDVVIGAAIAGTAGRHLTVVGNGNQMALETQTVPIPATLLFANSGDTLWDISPVPINGTDVQEIRFFRRTSTTGAVNFTLLAPNTSTARIKLSPTGSQLSGNSFFTLPVVFGSTTIANKYPILVQQISGVGQTAENSIARFATSNPALTYSFNTTAGALTCYGVHVDNTTVKSAGANPLTVVGLFATAGGGDVNIAGQFVGLVDVTGSINSTVSFQIGGTKVVGAQGAAVPDAAGGATIDVEARAAINTLLARLRAATGHGLIV